MSRAVLIGLAVLAGTFAIAAVLARPNLPTEPAPETAAPPTVDAMVAHFDQLAFRGHGRNRLSRWFGPIYLVLDTSSDRERIPEFKIDVLAMELRRSTGYFAVPVLNRDTQSAENAIRLYVGGPNAAPLIERRFDAEGSDNCAMVRVRRPEDGRPHSGTVALTGEFAEELLSPCLLWGVASILGLQAPACVVRPSLFCDADPKDQVYPLDLLMLEALFHPKVEQGMTRADALPIVRRFFMEKIQALQTAPNRPEDSDPHDRPSPA
ncbi:MAG: DUF2927 domain-containing protein [Alphaproteobacteria bacterium]